MIPKKKPFSLVFYSSKSIQYLTYSFAPPTLFSVCDIVLRKWFVRIIFLNFQQLRSEVATVTGIDKKNNNNKATCTTHVREIMKWSSTPVHFHRSQTRIECWDSMGKRTCKLHEMPTIRLGTIRETRYRKYGLRTSNVPRCLFVERPIIFY